MELLNVENLHVVVDENEVIKGASLKIKEGELHVIMGPNGAGKSSLVKYLSGHPAYKASGGNTTFLEANLSKISVEDRFLRGLFVSFQHCVEIPEINNGRFMYNSYKNLCRNRGEEILQIGDFEKVFKEKCKELCIDGNFFHRGVNEGFSGGEKKKNEILQMEIFLPIVSILDEIDSGVDTDYLKIIAESIMKQKKRGGSCLLITHYDKLLKLLDVDFVHIMKEGNVVYSGDSTLVEKVESEGYQWTKSL